MSLHRHHRMFPSVLALVALLAGIGAAGFVRADDPKQGSKEKVALGGALVCVGCHLEGKYGAEAQCTLHAKHAQGFLAEDGTLYTFLDNARGHILLTEKKLREKRLKLEAYRFPKALVLEAIRFQLEDGGAWAQWDYCKNCGFEKGDHAGKDLCDDCAK